MDCWDSSGRGRLARTKPAPKWRERKSNRKKFMLWIFSGFCDCTQAFRLFFQLLVRFTIQGRGKREFFRSFLFLAQGLVHPRQFVVNRPIVIVGYGDLE